MLLSHYGCHALLHETILKKIYVMICKTSKSQFSKNVIVQYSDLK